MRGNYVVPSVDLDDSGDDSDGLTEYLDDPQIEKFKAFSDTQLDDEITKYEGYVAGGQKDGLKLKDGGDKFRKTLQKLERVRSDRAKKRPPVGVSQKPVDIESSDDFSSEPGGVGDWQRRSGTRSTAPSDLSRILGACSTVKTDDLSTKLSPSGSALHEPSKSAPCNNGKSILSSEIISRSSSPKRMAACSLERATRSSSGEQAGPSSRELSTLNQLDPCGSCSVCKKTAFILSNVRGINGLLCSMCRRKAMTPDPSFQLASDLKTPATKLMGVRTRKRKPETDVVGGTPDTAMEIDSSDEDEKPSICNGFAQLYSFDEQPRRMGRRGKLGRRMEDTKAKIAYPSRMDPDAVEILRTDVSRLDPMEFLNDTVIDFYIKYIQRDEFLSLEGKQRFHFFNSFFYKKLSEVVGSQKKKGGADFSKLRKWTKGTNIFEKDYLFVPIHDKLHWSLAIICFPGCDKGNRSERCIIHLDSMAHGHDSQRVFRLLKSYLVAEWKHSVEAGDHEVDECPHTLQSLKNDDIPCRKVQVPLQDNESDCGLFLLHYIQKFVEHAPKSMKPSDLDGNLEALGVFGRDWFHSNEASSLRTSIQLQLLQLFEQEQSDHEESMFGQSNKEDKSDYSTTGPCEVVIPLDGEAS